MTHDTQQTIDFDCTDELAKEEVREFITQEMQLATSSGEPKWSEGLLLLVQHGMKRWDEETDIDPVTFQHELDTAHEKMREYKQEYEERLEQLENENQRLRNELEDARSASPSP